MAVDRGQAWSKATASRSALHLAPRDALETADRTPPTRAARRIRAPIPDTRRAADPLIGHGYTRVVTAHQASDPPLLQPLVVSAPWGNYIQPDGCTATLGTFTALARGGRVYRILRTVRYYPRAKAWINQIGLRNPGLPWLVDRVRSGGKSVEGRLVSIHGFDDEQWWSLLAGCEAIGPGGIELNMSCPNVGEIDWPCDLFERAVATGLPVVVKLPPVNYADMAEQAFGAGVRCFHCCNTLPTPNGGISGAPLRPVALACIRDLRARWGRDSVRLIGGGGINQPEDIDAYAEAGADVFAVGTKLMNPVYLFRYAGLLPLLERARARARTGLSNSSDDAASYESR